jgi:hypothetical protein
MSLLLTLQLIYSPSRWSLGCTTCLVTVLAAFQQTSTRVVFRGSFDTHQLFAFTADVKTIFTRFLTTPSARTVFVARSTGTLALVFCTLSVYRVALVIVWGWVWLQNVLSVVEVSLTVGWQVHTVADGSVKNLLPSYSLTFQTKAAEIWGLSVRLIFACRAVW